jgi:hypothetical protein
VTIDWDLVAKIVSPILGALAGAFAKHLLDSRPKVVAFLGHVSGVALQSTNPPMFVGTHSVVLRNAGGKAAKGIRLGHNTLPDYSIYPDTPHVVNTLPSGAKEIQIASLVPKKQITITYLYFPPLTWEQVNTYLEHEEGSVRVLQVLPAIQPARWLVVVAWVLMGVGASTLIYVLVALLQRLAGA